MICEIIRFSTNPKRSPEKKMNKLTHAQYETILEMEFIDPHYKVLNYWSKGVYFKNPDDFSYRSNIRKLRHCFRYVEEAGETIDLRS